MSQKPTVNVRIPGKLMLAGEYAVLMGAPALLACVDRYVSVQVAPAQDVSSISMQGFANTAAEFTMQRKRVRWGADVDSQPFALATALLEQFPPATPVAVQIDSRAFYDGQRKLGLGSSAAVAVALGISLAQFADHGDVLEGISAAHRRFQKGKGSGADVHAVARGGVVIFRHDNKRSVANTARWPDGLLAQPVRCQRAADTIDRITRFSSWLTSDPAARKTLEEAVESANSIANCWRTGTPTAIIAAMNDYADQMRALDGAAQLGYLTGGHRQLSRLAADAGVFYKPCGAGGGDYGIALTTAPDKLAAFNELAATAGFVIEPMDLSDSRPSMTIEPAERQA